MDGSDLYNLQLEPMDFSLSEIPCVRYHITYFYLFGLFGAGAVDYHMSWLQFEGQGFGLLDGGCACYGGVGVRVAALEWGGGLGIFGKGWGLKGYDCGCFVSLLFGSLCNEEVVLGLLQLELRSSKLLLGFLQLLADANGVVQNLVEDAGNFQINIVYFLEVGLGVIVEWGGNLNLVACGLYNQVGFCFFVELIREDFFCYMVGLEGEIVSVVGI